MERKIAMGGGLGLALSVIIIWAFNQATGVEVPAEVATAFGAVMTTLVGYLVPSKK